MQRFPRLRTDLPALYAAYYVAELLADWTEDYDPHPLLFDEALATLETLGSAPGVTGPRLARFELVLLQELGYSPVLERVPPVAGAVAGRGLAFSAAAGGLLCAGVPAVASATARPSVAGCMQALRALARRGKRGARSDGPAVRARGAPGARPVRHLPAGPAAAPVALPGELRP